MEEDESTEPDTIADEEGYRRMQNVLDNLSYSPEGVARGAMRALDEWAAHKGLVSPVAAAREACAKVALAFEYHDATVHDIAAAIRARK